MYSHLQYPVQTTGNVFLSSQNSNHGASTPHGNCVESLASVVDNLKNHLDAFLRKSYSESQTHHNDNSACPRVVTTQPMENPSGHFAFTIGGLNPQLKELTIKAIKSQSFGKFVSDRVTYGEDSISATLYIDVQALQKESTDLAKKVHEDYVNTWGASRRGSSIGNDSDSTESSDDYDLDDESDSDEIEKEKKHSKMSNQWTLEMLCNGGFLIVIFSLLSVLCAFFVLRFKE